MHAPDSIVVDSVRTLFLEKNMPNFCFLILNQSSGQGDFYRMFQEDFSHFEACEGGRSSDHKKKET